jgi:hypothetical protein
VKLNLLYLNFLFLLSCTQPIGNSLLVDQKSTCDVFTGCTDTNTTTGEGLEIQSYSSTLSSNLDQSDAVQVSGTCKDLGRKNNRILVEVFAGEDETTDPFINNTISDNCSSSTNSIRSGIESVFISPKNVAMGPSQTFTLSASGGTAPYTFSLASGSGGVTASGLYTSPAGNSIDVIQVTDGNGETSRAIISVIAGFTSPVASPDNKKCITVTEGIGRIEDSGLPNQRTFPQCHNGKFGFSVRLGKILVNPASGQSNYKYLIRYKLRTQEGSVSDSAWSRVTVDRNLTTPLINSALNVNTEQKCTVNSSAARFNPGILYTLNRTFTDIVSTSAGSVNLFSNANTSVKTPGTSIFEWDDKGLTDGVTYNYTLSSKDMNFSYAPLTTPTLSSAVVTCETTRPKIDFLAPPGTGTCYFKLTSAEGGYQFNPYVTYEWGYSTAGASWIGSTGKTNSGFTRGFSAGCSCPAVPSPTDPFCVAPYNPAICTQSGLSNALTYFFAVRTRNLTTGEIGKWSSNVLSCKPL